MTGHRPRKILPPGGTRKRKKREAPCLPLPLPSGPPAATPTTPAYSANAREAGEAKPMSWNRLLAGYMAHEFLTRGTLFGQKFDSGGSAAVHSATSSSPASAAPAMIRKEDNNRAEMASIVKSDETHIPGIVNPSQLARWMQR
ncbi:hypothetical protein QN277_027139 [Acacia crassicarpa]|uniref:Uncharacterized protein n=1 Tax=Acacia crassicarpa TaxID=499986 RepID=A0AAE1K5I3_9FABA|nr:hypothetical protein QN277_027139 [Acacia crassicarpa]